MSLPGLDSGCRSVQLNIPRWELRGPGYSWLSKQGYSGCLPLTPSNGLRRCLCLQIRVAFSVELQLRQMRSSDAIPQRGPVIRPRNDSASLSCPVYVTLSNPTMLSQLQAATRRNRFDRSQCMAGHTLICRVRLRECHAACPLYSAQCCTAV